MDTDHIRSFFDLFSYDLEDTQNLLLWMLHPHTNEKRSVFLSSLKEAAQVLQAYEDWHCYWGVGLRPHQPIPRPHWRGGSGDITALLALHGDIDILHPVAHKNQHLPPDLPAAHALIQAIPLRPTCKVLTGYGVQPLWISKEPILLETEDDRRIAQEVCRRLHALILRKAQAHGWQVDATHDLSRVLRIPGTTNWKDPQNPQPCLLTEQDGPLYNGLSDFLDELPTIELERRPDVDTRLRQETQGLVLDRSINPDKFMAFMENDRKFARTWEKKRTDLRDSSHSGYDMSLVSLALRAEWTPQEVLGLLLQYGEKHHQEQKRPEYYKYTIQKGLLWIKEKGESESMVLTEYQTEKEARKKGDEASSQEEQDREDKTPLLDELSAFLDMPPGVRIIDKVRSEGDEPHDEFLVELPDGKTGLVSLTDQEVYSFTTVITAFRKVTGYFCLKRGTKATARWYALLNRLAKVTETRPEEEMETTYIIRTYLEAYHNRDRTAHIERRNSDHISKRQECVRRHGCFIEEDKFYFTLKDFMEYLTRDGQHFTYSRYLITRALRALEGESFRLAYPRDHSQAFVRYWRMPLTRIHDETPDTEKTPS